MYFKSTIYFILLIGFLTSFPNSFYGQEDTALVRTFGGNGLEEGREIIACADGGYAVVGTEVNSETGNSNVYLLRLDDQLHCVWGYSYGNIAIEKGFSIVETEEGHFMLAGYGTEIEGNGYDVLVMKIDTDGNPLWLKYFGGNDWDFANKIIAHPNGGFLIAGKTYSAGNGSSDGYLLHIDGDGNSISEWTYGLENEDEFLDITIHSNSIFVCGKKSNSDFVPQGWLCQLSLNGIIQNEILESDTIPSVGVCLTSHETHGVYYGIQLYREETWRNSRVKNFDESGNQIFEYDGYYLQVQDIACANDSYVLTGWTDLYGAGGWGSMIEQRTWDGIYLNAPSFGGIYDDELYSVIINDQDEPMLVGKSNSYTSATHFDVYAVGLPSSDIQQEYILDMLQSNCLLSAIPSSDILQSIAQAKGSSIVFNDSQPHELSIFDSIGKLLHHSKAAVEFDTREFKGPIIIKIDDQWILRIVNL